MKRLMVVLCLVLFTSGLAWGGGVNSGPSKVSVGSHNLSTSGPSPFGYNTDEDSICVFCHTPHGGTLDAPLWNRGSDFTSSWQHYNSASLSTALQGLNTQRPPNAESLLCLSCHDGSLSVNHVINLPNDREGAPILSDSTNNPDTKIIDFFGDPGARIGGKRGFGTSGNTGDFTDDHPFSFSYNDVLASDEYQTGNAKFEMLWEAQEAIDRGVQFFGGANNVECSSCHDPHVNHDGSTPTGDSGYKPFLIMKNTGSALCLACHRK